MCHPKTLTHPRPPTHQSLGSTCTSLATVANRNTQLFSFPTTDAAGWTAYSVESASRAEAYVVSLSSANQALQGVLRGLQVVGNNTLAFVAPLGRSLVTSYGGMAMFRLMYRRFFLTSGPLSPRTARLSIVSTVGPALTTVIRASSQALAPGEWLSINVSLSVEASSSTAWELDGVPSPSRAQVLQVLGSVQR